MEDLKIKVENNLDELVEFFKGYGCKNFSYTCPTRNYILLEKGMLHFCKLKSNFKKSGAREVNVSQLKDLVVLKRGDVGDANVKEENCLYDLYLTQSNDLYFYHCGKNKWILSNVSNDEDYCKLLKPIEPKMSILDTGRLEMKEYLEPMPNGEYRYHKDEGISIGGDWIEVPAGAEILSTCGSDEGLIFWRDGSNMVLGVDKGWDGDDIPPYRDFKKEYPLSHIVWQRETLNDKVASAEVARGRRKTYGFTPEIASRISSKTEGAYMAVSETLKARQSTYGSFEDVASVTQDLLSILKKTGLEGLPKPHKEAMHMICSKMARIVNGDFNHLDSWHDIGGYAKLIENLIGEENENRSED